MHQVLAIERPPLSPWPLFPSTYAPWGPYVLGAVGWDPFVVQALGRWDLSEALLSLTGEDGLSTHGLQLDLLILISRGYG